MKADHIVEALTGDSGWKDMVPQVDSSDFPTQWVPSAYECSIIDAQAKEIEKLRAQLRHLEELAEADKDGRLVVLPCKVGDTVYYWDGCQIIDYKVENFSVFDGNEWLMYGVHREKGTGIGFGREFWAHEFKYCKTVFLTSEEAKAALEAMKDV